MSLPPIFHRLDPRTNWRGFVRVIVLLVLARGVIIACALPPFEGWDEYQHVAYIVHILETGEDPVLRQTSVPKSLLRAVVRFPQPPAAVEQIEAAGAVDYATYWQRGPRPSADTLPDVPLYQAQHASLYYRLVAPLFAWLGGIEDLRAAVSGLRLLNVCLTALAVKLILNALGLLLKNRFAAAVGGLAIATHPLFLMNSVRLSNDALGALLASAAIVIALRMVADSGKSRDGDYGPKPLFRTTSLGPTVLQCIALGGLIGLAVLAKSVNLALVPFALTCIVWSGLRGRLSAAATVGRLAAAMIVLAAITQHYFRFNMTHFGLLTPMQEALVNREAGRGAGDAVLTALRLDWIRATDELWVRSNRWVGGWSFVPASRRYQSGQMWGLAAAFAGWLWAALRWGGRRLRSGGRVERGAGEAAAQYSLFAACLLLCLCFTTALSYHTVQCQLAWGEPVMNPWYAAAAVPWFLVLAVGGCAAWPGRRLKFLPLAWLIAVFVMSEVNGVLGRMVTTYSQLPLGRSAFERLATLQPAWLGTPTLVLAVLCAAGLLAVAVACVLVAGRKSPIDQSRAA
ncbi:MAG: hypothetical protein L6R00_20795 [Phycisphaerae bacterium]|nr:hypothetical protein [Phycisphaerae bacterium]